MGLTVGSLITSEDIYTEQGLKEQVINYSDWAGLYRTPTSFALFSHFGTINTNNNGKILMNNATGMPRKATAGADITVAAVGSVVIIDISTITSALFSATNLREGHMFRVNGWNTAGTPVRSSALIKVTNVVGTDVYFKTLSITSTGSYVFDFNSTKGVTVVHLTNSEDLSGQAPESTTLTPTQTYNWSQLYRFPYGVTSDMESSDKHFTNERINNSMEAKDQLFGAINHDLLFSAVPLKPQSAESGGAAGTGDNSSVMGGLPWLLDMADLSSSSVVSHSIEYTAITTQALALDVLDGLMDWADKFGSTSGVLYGLTSKTMRAFIRRAIMLAGETMIPGKVMLPDLSIYYEEINLGDVSIRLVCDEDLSTGSAPLISDGTTYVYKNYFIIALDLSTVGISYRNRVAVKDNPLSGIMAMKLADIPQIRNGLTYEAEAVAELTCGITRKDRNGIFYLYDIA